MRRYSTYAYSFDNPIRFSDPDGMIPEDQTDPKQEKPKEKTWDDLNFFEKGAAALLYYVAEFGENVNELSGNETDDPVDNLVTGVSTIGDIVVGTQGHKDMLSPGTSSSKAKGTADDVATKTVTVADDATSLAARAKQIHNAVPEATQRRTTIAVGSALNGEGQVTRIVASSENRLRSSQRALLQAGEVEATGSGHAEITLINYAKANNMTVGKIAASRPICQNCASAMQSNNVAAASALKRFARLHTME